MTPPRAGELREWLFVIFCDIGIDILTVPLLDPCEIESLIRLLFCSVHDNKITGDKRWTTTEERRRIQYYS